MKILVITNLFPNTQETVRGAFNRQQIVELSRLCDVKVVAPLPLHYNRQIPEIEVIDGIEVYHPRYFMTPKVGRSLYGFFFFLSLINKVKTIQNTFDFDLIYATWAYPDGFGSYLISKVLKKPIIIKTHGSDINMYARYYLRRKMIAHALANSNAVIAVSNALKDRLVAIGVPHHKVVTVTNGIDNTLFRPLPQNTCRRDLALPENIKIVLFIGNLVPVKGVRFLIEAFSRLSGLKDEHLVLLGDGDEKAELVKMAERLHLADRIQFVGRQPHDVIPLWMNACDVFCLPSINEGCPNVILEALACGKPVVATDAGGIPEIITSDKQGIIVPAKNTDALARALELALRKPWAKQPSTTISWRQNAQIVFDECKMAIADNT